MKALWHGRACIDPSSGPSDPDRRVDPDLRGDRELLIPHGGAKGSHLPDPDLLCQREDEGGQAAGGQPAGGVAVLGQDGDVERQDAEDPAGVALHLGLQHHPSGVLPHGEDAAFSFKPDLTHSH